MKPTCWVFGANGLVGEALRKTPSQKYEFFFLGRDDYEIGSTKPLPKFGPYDAVIDLIPTPTPRYMQELKAAEYHAQFTAPHERFLADVQRSGVKKIVFLSSGGTVYGTGQVGHAFKESEPLRPQSYYGESKVILETALRSFSGAAVLRPSNIYNADPAGKKQTGAVGVFLTRFHDLAPLDILGSEDIAKDYVSNRDVAQAIVLCLDKDINGTFNIGSGTVTSLRSLIQAFEEKFNHQATRNLRAAQANDVTFFALDIGKAKSELGYRPQDQVCDWIRNLRL